MVLTLREKRNYSTEKKEDVAEKKQESTNNKSTEDADKEKGEYYADMRPEKVKPLSFKTKAIMVLTAAGLVTWIGSLVYQQNLKRERPFVEMMHLIQHDFQVEKKFSKVTLHPWYSFKG